MTLGNDRFENPSIVLLSFQGTTQPKAAMNSSCYLQTRQDSINHFSDYLKCRHILCYILIFRTGYPKGTYKQ